MISVYLAELRKQRGLAFARSALILVLLGGVAVILAIAGLDASGVLQTRQLLGWPSVIELWVSLSHGVVFFLVPSLAAWGVGLEQTHDTWKMVLTRRSPRRVVLFAKIAMTLSWLAVYLALSFVAWVGLGSLLGLLLPLQQTVQLRHELLGLAQSLIHSVALVPGVTFVALRARSNGTLLGTLVGILGPMAIQLTELWGWVNFNRLMPLFTAEALVLRLSDTAEATVRADALVGPSWGVAQCGLVLITWVLAPLAAAIWHFERKDILTELA